MGMLNVTDNIDDLKGLDVTADGYVRDIRDTDAPDNGPMGRKKTKKTSEQCTSRRKLTPFYAQPQSDIEEGEVWF